MFKRSMSYYENLHNSKFPKSKITVIKKEGSYIYFETEFGICKKHISNFQKHSYSINSALNKTEYLTNQLIKIHGYKYDYSCLIYTTFNEKIDIICKIHGKFKQIADSHLRGNGCFECGKILDSEYHKENPTGWSLSNWIQSAKKSKNFDSFKVYIIECWNNNEKFYKIGRTFRLINLRFHSKTMPYNYKILKIYVDNAKNIYNLETKLKKLNKLNKYTPKLKFNGKHECYNNIINLI